MANHYYIFSEVQFFNDKGDKKVWDFIEGTGIDLSGECESIMPTLSEIKKSLTDFGLVTTELLKETGRIEFSALESEGNGLWLIFNDINNDESMVGIFEVGRGSNPELLIDFIQFMTKTHGNFLYYLDAGLMSLITKDKSKKQILKEMNFLI